MRANIRRGAIVASIAAAVVAGVVSVAAQQQPRRVVNLPGRSDHAPYADAVVVGDTVYLAGRLGLQAPGNTPPADPVEEARLILDGMKTVLAEAGLTMDDLVSVEVYCSDVSLLETFNAVYRRYFTKGFPARAFIGTGALLFGARFEVKGIAVKSR